MTDSLNLVLSNLNFTENFSLIFLNIGVSMPGHFSTYIFHLCDYFLKKIVDITINFDDIK